MSLPALNDVLNSAARPLWAKKIPLGAAYWDFTVELIGVQPFRNQEAGCFFENFLFSFFPQGYKRAAGAKNRLNPKLRANFRSGIRNPGTKAILKDESRIRNPGTKANLKNHKAVRACVFLRK